MNNIRNIIIIISSIILILAMWHLATYLDTKLGTNVWSNRFWDTGLSGLSGALVVIVTFIFSFFKID